jgi:hypothetical protein
MFPLTRFLSLAAAGALVALTAASSPARADESAQNLARSHKPILTTVGQADLNPRQMGECSLQRRAISRRACQARLWRGVHIDTAENN